MIKPTGFAQNPLSIHTRAAFLQSAVAALVIPALLAAVLWWAPAAYANPFEELPEGHWSYRLLEQLSSRELVSGYLLDRLRLGYAATYFDVALSMGQALDRLQQLESKENPSSDFTLDALVGRYNKLYPERALSADQKESLAELLELVAGELEILGYDVPADVKASMGGGTPVDGLARALEGFRMEGESRIRYRDVEGLPQVDSSPDEGGLNNGSDLEQSYTLRLSGPVSTRINVGAELAGANRLWSDDQKEAFQLQSGAVNVGLSRAAVARIGTVTGKGFSDVALGDAVPMTGLQAGMKLGQLGSTLLLATTPTPAGSLGTTSGFVTAWDGTVQLTDKINLAATLARLDADGEPGDADASTVVSVGGTFHVSPTLTLSGEMAQSSSVEGGAGAVKVGAVLHPLPDFTLGARMLSTTGGFRRLFSTEDDPTSSLDLSAEVGRWILSLRRQQVVRDGDQDSTLTQLQIEYPLSEHAIARASRESESDDPSHPADRDVKTELDLELRFDRGKINLGYVLEGLGDESGEPTSVRTAKASVEHAVGPIGKAQAGFAIVDQVQGSETSGNVGLSYDFENASVSLQYEIYKGVGDDQGNVTTAEVSIRF